MKKWAFIIHPRDEIDMVEAIDYLPDEVDVRQLAKTMEPRVVCHVVSKKSEGWLVGCFLFPDQFYNLPLKFVRKKILDSVLFAKQLGAEIIGLGQLISPFTSAGRWLTRKTAGLLITTGNSLTAIVVSEEAEKLIKLMDGDVEEIWIAIVGATGSIGNAVSQILKRKNLILVARNTQRLQQLRSLIRSDHYEVITSNEIDDIKTAHLVIVLTSAAETIIEAKHLREEGTVYDITQPPNVDPRILKKRSDITLIQGGLMQRDGLKLNFDLRIPRETLFACIAETIVLAEKYESQTFSQCELVGQVKVEVAKKFLFLAEECGFEPSGSRFPIH